ncbi:MAG: HDOD domain-containing protein [Gammaproteobacteria bacterium]|nr:HDOD domain-containing protein [Gammaproteobacteria bacterium]
MSKIANRLNKYLVQQQLSYRAAKPGELPPANLIVARLLCDDNDCALVVFPASLHFDITVLSTLTGRNWHDASEARVRKLFDDCDPRNLPAMAGAYGINALVDDSISSFASVTFPAGNTETIIEMARADFAQSLGKAQRLSFASDKEAAPILDARVNDQPDLYLKLTRLELPMMPESATRILRFMNHPHARIDELVSVIEADPALTGQILRYASSPFFGFQGEIDSVHKAITIVLGQDMVYSIALGLSMLGKLMMPRQQRKEFTRHAVYCAALSQEIARSLPRKYGAKQGRAYLAGLLHNIGRALLYHLYPTDMAGIAEEFQQHPERPLTEIESEALQINHTQAGLLLLQQWKLDSAIFNTACYHHNEDYNGDDALYCHITLLANRFLATRDIGEEITDVLPASILARYEIDEINLQLNLEDILDAAEHLDGMVNMLAP